MSFPGSAKREPGMTACFNTRPHRAPALAVLDRVDQQVEDLRPGRNHLQCPGELAPVSVEEAVSEQKLHFGAPQPDGGRRPGRGPTSSVRAGHLIARLSPATVGSAFFWTNNQGKFK